MIQAFRGLPRGELATPKAGKAGGSSPRDLSGMGLMDYKARAYDAGPLPAAAASPCDASRRDDPLLMRFIQPDSIIPNPAEPQSWNRYSYVRNSPIMFVDPTGHYEDEGCGMGESCELPPDNSPIIIEDEDEQDSGPSTNLVLNCFSDPGACYLQGWSNFGAAWSIYSNTSALASDRVLAGLYMGLWVDAHILGATGGILLLREGVIVIGAQLATKNPGAAMTMIGRYNSDFDNYILRAGSRFTYFDVGKAGYRILKPLGLADPINMQFIRNQVSAGKAFAMYGQPIASSNLAMELTEVLNSGYAMIPVLGKTLSYLVLAGN